MNKLRIFIDIHRYHYKETINVFGFYNNHIYLFQDYGDYDVDEKYEFCETSYGYFRNSYTVEVNIKDISKYNKKMQNVINSFYDIMCKKIRVDKINNILD